MQGGWSGPSGSPRRASLPSPSTRLALLPRCVCPLPCLFPFPFVAVNLLGVRRDISGLLSALTVFTPLPSALEAEASYKLAGLLERPPLYAARPDVARPQPVSPTSPLVRVYLRRGGRDITWPRIGFSPRSPLRSALKPKGACILPRLFKRPPL